MIRTRTTAWIGTALLLAGAASAGDDASAAQAVPQPAKFSRCEVDGPAIQYRTYLPDQRRFLFVSVKVLKGLHPSVFVIVDKDFDQNHVDLTKTADPLVAWWLDRSKPVSFSTDKIRIGWRDRSGWRYITSLVGEDNQAEMDLSIRGLTKKGDHFEGIGSPDNNTFAFQSRIELADFGGDEFSVFVPAVSYDGATVAVPEVHFENTDENPQPKC